MITPPADNPLWRFALERYGRPGVQRACAALQDEAGIDVAFLFACAWLASRGTTVEAAEGAIARALESVRTVRAEVLAPLRTARRRLKHLGDAREVEPTRELVKDAELAVEALCFARIHAALSAAPVGPPGGADVPGLFEAYLVHEGLSLDAVARSQVDDVLATLAAK